MEASPGTGRGAAVAAAVRRLLLGTWLGATAFMGLVTAPIIFRTMRTAALDRRSPAPEQMSGDIVVRNLEALSQVGLWCALLALALLWVERPARRMMAQVVVLALGLVCVVLTMAWLTPTMLDLQAQMGGPIDGVPLDHPLRVSFRGLHGYSSGLHLGMMVSAAVALILEPRGR